MEKPILISLDGKIKKTLISCGEWGRKPFNLTECDVEISGNCDELNKLTKIIIGESEGNAGRYLDKCLMTMHKGEISSFEIVDDNLIFIVNLLNFQFNGFIYEWNTPKKLEISYRYKKRGNELFQLNNYKEATYKFVRGLKIILSIPIDVTKTSEFIDGISINEINQIKMTLYNNLASCNLKQENWDKVIDLSKIVLKFDEKNVKALYKIGVAYMKDNNFELAKASFEEVLKQEHNQAVSEYLKYVNEEIKKATIRVNALIKKMFA